MQKARESQSDIVIRPANSDLIQPSQPTQIPTPRRAIPQTAAMLHTKPRKFGHIWMARKLLEEPNCYDGFPPGWRDGD